MAPLKHLLVVAMTGLVLLTASVAADGATMPAITASDVDAHPTTDLTSAVARVGATKSAASVVKGLSGTDAAADKQALALDDTSDRTFVKVIKVRRRCLRFALVKVCKKVNVCRVRTVVHKLVADGGAAEGDAAVADDAVDAAARNVDVDATSRRFLATKKVLVKRKVVVKRRVVVVKPVIPLTCIRTVCKFVKRCVLFH